MKTKTFIITVFLIVSGLLFTSCDNFLDVNTDPNNPSDVSPALILPGAFAATASYISGSRQSVNMLGNLFMFNFTQAYGFSWYPSQLKYNLTTDFYSNLFTDAYSTRVQHSGFLVQYTHLANLTDKQWGYYKAIGMIMQAYHYQILVDLYGSVPYSDAEKRAADPTPAYDKGQAIYDSLVVKLNDAIDVINQTKSVAGANKPTSTSDGVFGGDMNKWGAFANSIKIRLLTRENGVKDKSYINDQLQMIFSNGYGFITQNVTDNPGYVKGTAGKQNPYWTNFAKSASGTVTNNNKATCATLFLVNWYKSTKDTLRFNSIFGVPDKGAIGINQGAITPDDDHDAQSYPGVANLKIGGAILKSADMGSVIMTAAEVQFNLAELALNGFNVPKSAADYYKAGVEASFVGFGLTADQADAYMDQPIKNVNWSTSPNKLNAIMTQKWLATLGLTAGQTWFDYNRTGLPNAKPFPPETRKGNAWPTAPTGWPISKLAVGHSERPVRLLYPSDEYSRNEANVPAPPGKPDPFTSKIFWAK